MKKYLAGIFLLISLFGNGQDDWYVAAKSGLSIREKPDANGKVLDKIPYGTKINVHYDSIKTINVEGMIAAWAKVAYNGKSGYIVNAYLLRLPPPKAGIKEMKQYFKQVSEPFGAELILKDKYRNLPDFEEGQGWESRKQLFKNGMEYHAWDGYESNSRTYFLPGFTIQETFVLMRLIPEFEEAFGEKDVFPRQTSTYKKGEVEYSITVDKEMIGNNVEWIYHIRLEFSPGATYTMEIFQTNDQVIIVFSGGA